MLSPDQVRQVIALFERFVAAMEDIAEAAQDDGLDDDSDDLEAEALATFRRGHSN